jgi:uncharacterized membrane protein YjjP (DUF1212 family)
MSYGTRKNQLIASKRITGTIMVAFIARGLSSISGNYFCYAAISQAGVVVLLPGFTVCQSAMSPQSIFVFDALSKWSARWNSCPGISSVDPYD